MYDILLRGGTVIDGTGGEGFVADVAVENGKIAAIAPTITGEAGQVIDATGQYVTPGFIDMHRHSDAFVFRPGFGEVQLRQGITTTINGNCGLSIVPSPKAWREDIMAYLRPIIGSLPAGLEFETFSDYMQCVENTKPPINFGMYIGNGTLRMAARGFASGSLTPAEIETVHSYLRDALQNGAFGVSLGIAYMPENMYTVDDYTTILAPVKGSGIPLVCHIRGEGDLLYQSVAEVIQIAKNLEVPLHISHYKCVGAENWGVLLRKTTGLIEENRAAGMQITCDAYPYVAGSSQLVQILPPDFLEGGMQKTMARLQDPVQRARCKEIMRQPQSYFENLLYLVGWENFLLTSVKTPANQKYVGKRMSEVAEMQGRDPYECCFDLLVEEDGDVAMVNFIASEQDNIDIIQLPYSIVISDSIYSDTGKPHPRQYGAFPKLLCDYVRERGLLRPETAIHKITGAPAKLLGIPGKGLLRQGYDADIAVFDLARLENPASFMEPKQLGRGFSYVLVNGQVANDHDSFIHTGAGKVLRRTHAPGGQ